MSKIKISERILDLGFKLSIAPVNFLSKYGIPGRVLCFIALVFYVMPMIFIFNFIGFTFWVFKK
jgi:hypothetical protein